MRWKCPACQTEIQYDGDTPQPGRVYRCHVCHLELIVDASMRTLAPLPTTRRLAEDSRRWFVRRLVGVSRRARFETGFKYTATDRRGNLLHAAGSNDQSL